MSSPNLPLPESLVPTPPLASAVAPRLATRLAELREMSSTLLAVESVQERVLWAVGGASLAALLFAIAVVWLQGHGRRGAALRGTARVLLPGVLAVPVASTLMFVVQPRATTSARAAGAYAGCLLFVWVVAAALGRARGTLTGLAWLCSVTSLVLLLDQWLGGPWSYTGFISYSPLRGKRFYGMGNEGAAILVGASIVGLAIVIDGLDGRSLAGTLRRWMTPVLGAVVVLTAAAPFMGANVTVAVWGSVGFGVFWVLATGRRFGWREAVFGTMAIVAMVAALVAADAWLGSGTHLGDAWRTLAAGRFGELGSLLTRKATMALRVLLWTPGPPFVVAMIALLARVRWRPSSRFKVFWAKHPTLGVAVSATIVASAAGFLTEDSGILVVTLVMAWPGVAVLWLLLDLDGEVTGEARGVD